MYDFITIAFIYISALCVFILFDGIIKRNKKQILRSALSIGLVAIISATAFFIDISASPQELVQKVNTMYRGHERSYLHIPQRMDKVRSYDGWIIDKLALIYLDNAIEQDPNYDEAKIKRCELYLYKKKYMEVIKYADTVSSEGRDNVKLLEWEAAAYYWLGDKEEALEKYSMYAAQNGSSSDLDILFIVSGLVK